MILIAINIFNVYIHVEIIFNHILLCVAIHIIEYLFIYIYIYAYVYIYIQIQIQYSIQRHMTYCERTKLHHYATAT